MPLVGCSHGHSGAASSESPVRTAHRLAQTMLRAAVLPAGARRLHGSPPPILAMSVGGPAMGNMTDDYQLWSVPQSVQTLRFFRFGPTSHGFTKQGVGGSTDTDAGHAWTSSAQLVDLPVNVAFAQLDGEVTQGASGSSVVRIDALVYWTPPKPTTEYVPSRDRVATLIALRPTSPSNVALRVVVTDAAKVKALATGFNNMRLAGVDERGECGYRVVDIPGMNRASPYTTIYEVEFSATTRAAPDLIVATPLCLGHVGVRAQGRQQPDLSTDDTFTRTITADLSGRA
jgi:hypothetical protein